MTNSSTNFQAIDNLIFKSSKVRAAYVDDELVFCLSDICKEIGIGHVATAAKRLLDDEKMTVCQTHMPGQIGGAQKLTYITESGVFRIIMRSDKKEALEFQNWLIKDVLPTIHRFGMYLEPEQVENVINHRDEDMLDLIKTIKSQNAKLHDAETHAAMYRMLSKIESDMELGEFARVLVSHGINVGPNKILKLFRELGVLTKNNTIKMRYINSNLFSSYAHVTDRITARTTITTAGIQEVIELIYTRPDIVDKYSHIDTHPKRRIKDIMSSTERDEDVGFIILHPKAGKTMESIITEMKARAGK